MSQFHQESYKIAEKNKGPHILWANFAGFTLDPLSSYVKISNSKPRKGVTFSTKGLKLQLQCRLSKKLIWSKFVAWVVPPNFRIRHYGTELSSFHLYRGGSTVCFKLWRENWSFYNREWLISSGLSGWMDEHQFDFLHQTQSRLYSNQKTLQNNQKTALIENREDL